MYVEPANCLFRGLVCFTWAVTVQWLRQWTWMTRFTFLYIATWVVDAIRRNICPELCQCWMLSVKSHLTCRWVCLIPQVFNHTTTKPDWLIDGWSAWCRKEIFIGLVPQAVNKNSWGVTVIAAVVWRLIWHFVRPMVRDLRAYQEWLRDCCRCCKAERDCSTHSLS